MMENIHKYNKEQFFFYELLKDIQKDIHYSNDRPGKVYITLTEHLKNVNNRVPEKFEPVELASMEKSIRDAVKDLTDLDLNVYLCTGVVILSEYLDSPEDMFDYIGKPKTDMIENIHKYNKEQFFFYELLKDIQKDIHYSNDRPGKVYITLTEHLKNVNNRVPEKFEPVELASMEKSIRDAVKDLTDLDLNVYLCTGVVILSEYLDSPEDMFDYIGKPKTDMMENIHKYNKEQFFFYELLKDIQKDIHYSNDRPGKVYITLTEHLKNVNNRVPEKFEPVELASMEKSIRDAVKDLTDLDLNVYLCTGVVILSEYLDSPEDMFDYIGKPKTDMIENIHKYNKEQFFFYELLKDIQKDIHYSNDRPGKVYITLTEHLKNVNNRVPEKFEPVELASMEKSIRDAVKDLTDLDLNVYLCTGVVILSEYLDSPEDMFDYIGKPKTDMIENIHKYNKEQFFFYELLKDIQKDIHYSNDRPGKVYITLTEHLKNVNNRVPEKFEPVELASMEKSIRDAVKDLTDLDLNVYLCTGVVILSEYLDSPEDMFDYIGKPKTDMMENIHKYNKEQFFFYELLKDIQEDIHYSNDRPGKVYITLTEHLKNVNNRVPEKFEPVELASMEESIRDAVKDLTDLDLNVYLCTGVVILSEYLDSPEDMFDYIGKSKRGM